MLSRMPTSTHRRLSAGLFTVLAVTLAACGDDDAATTPATTDRQTAVADRGADVMPFDLDASTHTFTPTDDGLIEDVVADDPDDGKNIALIREHLTSERDLFESGDFADPAAIHGDAMPGLADLEAGASDIEIAYSELDDGARLTFTSEDPALVDALHRWGEAQVMDHGEHDDAG